MWPTLRLISRGSPAEDPRGQPGWVLDAEGDAWPFYPETVLGVEAVRLLQAT